MRHAAVVLGSLLAAATATATAQTVYRCGPDGRSYTQQPCPEGRRVALDDTSSAGAPAEARERIQRDAKAADALERERLRREAVRLRAGSLGRGPAAERVATRAAQKPVKSGADTRSKADRAPEEFRAVSPVPPAPKKTSVR